MKAFVLHSCVFRLRIERTLFSIDFAQKSVADVLGEHLP
jgi:hypothetical protein